MVRTQTAAKSALRFIIIIGIVGLFADFTYEGARSINGQFLAMLGASATVVGFTAGFGELLGYGLRSLFGLFADRTGRYWLVTIIGYCINLFAVPALALAGSWQVAVALVLAERAGRAMRKPPVEAMLSDAGKHVGQGWAFGVYEALDQAGATVGPLVMSLILLLHGSYRRGYSLLLVSAILAITTVLVARHFHTSQQTDGDVNVRMKDYGRSYWWYMIAGCCVAAGFADFSLVGYHFQKTGVVPADLVPVYYAVAMGIGSIGALVFGKLFDKNAIATILATFFASAFFAPLVFLGNAEAAFAGIVLWGIGMSTQESLLKPLVAHVLHTAKKATAFGIYDTGYGIAWFLGSWLMGYLYSHSIHELVIFSVALQLVALPVFWFAHRQAPGSY